VVQYQNRLPMPSDSESTRIGIPAYLTDPALQTDVFKELVNKFAWAIGSTYRRSYTKHRSNVRIAAADLARTFITDEGYPLSISK